MGVLALDEVFCQNFGLSLEEHTLESRPADIFRESNRELQVTEGPVFGHFPSALSRFHCLLGYEVRLETTGHKQTIQLRRELRDSNIYEAYKWRN